MIGMKAKRRLIKLVNREIIKSWAAFVMAKSRAFHE